MKELLEQYQREMEGELDAILRFWMEHAIDGENGGFIGRVDHNNKAYPEAPKGSVMNSRILWAFSAAYRLSRKEEYLKVAGRAYQYLVTYFVDQEYGGVYWTVDYKGAPLDTKKQIYALAFAVYGLCEFYRASQQAGAKLLAIDLYNDIVAHSYHKRYGGYLEALSRDWKELEDLRLSAKDANERKSMNTHLHLLEAFTALYRVWPGEMLRQQVAQLVNDFLHHIISKENDHLILFFDDAWQQRSHIISYGHDIEAAWLLQEGASAIGNGLLQMNVKHYARKLTEAAAKGLDGDGGLWYEYDYETHHLVKEKHSWPQAEAMVGFFNAWQLTGDEKYLKQSLKSWQFVKEYIHDKKGGEWLWGVYEDYSPMNKEDKIGIWKCPYHNSRACMEIIERITTLLD